jgi:O-antigen ligase
MRIIGLVLVAISLLFFLYLLQNSPRTRRWAFVILGMMPILAQGLGLDASIVNWAYWPGHTKGIIVSLVDSLAIAVCMHFRRTNRPPRLLYVWIVYLLCSACGVFSGDMVAPALFTIFSILRAVLYFWASYLVISNGGLVPLAQGLAVAVLANAGVTIANSLGGEAQAAGLLGHRNFSGLIGNLALPVLITVGLHGRVRPLMLLAVIGAGMSAIAGGSRGVIIFYGVTVLLTMIAAVTIQPNTRRIFALVACLIGVAAAIPVAQHKLAERFQKQQTQFTLEKDGERKQLEKIARLMVADHPFGVGLNQFVVASNTLGYADRVGLVPTLGSRGATVHNSYLLGYAEAGPVGWFGVVFLLWVPQLYAFTLVVRRQSIHRIIIAPGLVALFVLSVHSFFEWAVPNMATLHGMALNMALIAATVEIARVKRRNTSANAITPASEARKVTSGRLASAR